MNYKLINKKTQEEHLCSKVVIDGFYYYVNTEESLSNNGDYYLSYPYYTKLFKWDMVGMHEEKKVWIKKVIATNNPNIDLPQVIDEVEELSNEYSLNRGLSQGLEQRMLDSFVNGYNKSQETHSFSEDDMVAFAKWLRVSGWQDYSDVLPDLFINDYDEKVSSKNLLELWKEQQTKTIYYDNI